jgi:hypothetical protein
VRDRPQGSCSGANAEEPNQLAVGALLAEIVEAGNAGRGNRGNYRPAGLATGEFAVREQSARQPQKHFDVTQRTSRQGHATPSLGREASRRFARRMRGVSLEMPLPSGEEERYER